MIVLLIIGHCGPFPLELAEFLVLTYKAANDEVAEAKSYKVIACPVHA